MRLGLLSAKLQWLSLGAAHGMFPWAGYVLQPGHAHAVVFTSQHTWACFDPVPATSSNICPAAGTYSTRSLSSSTIFADQSQCHLGHVTDVVAV